MKIQRWVCLTSIVVIAISLVALAVIERETLDASLYDLLYALLTGLVSGAFFAMVTLSCEYIIKATQQRKQLLYLCQALAIDLQSSGLLFAGIESRELPFDSFSAAWECLQGAGLTCANAICTDIDGDLFLCRERSNELGKLRNIASELGPRISRLWSSCLTIQQQERKLDGMKLDPNYQYVDHEELEGMLGSFEKSTFKEAHLIVTEYLDRIHKSVKVLYSSKKLASFDDCLNDEKVRVEKLIAETAALNSSFK